MSVSHRTASHWRKRLAVLLPVVLTAGITSVVLVTTADTTPQVQRSELDASASAAPGERPTAESASLDAASARRSRVSAGRGANIGLRTGRSPDISDAAWRNAANEGIPILRSPEELQAYVREFG